MTRIKSNIPSLVLMAFTVAIFIGCGSADRPEEEAPTRQASPTADVAEVPSVAATQPGDAVVESLPTVTAEAEVQSSFTPFVEKEVQREPARVGVAPTIEEHIINRSYNTYWEPYTEVPHFVARGTFVAGTTRCRTEHFFPSKIVGLSTPKYKGAGPTLYKDLVVCVSDFVVDEYMVGSGPDRLTFFTYEVWGGRVIPDFDSSDTSNDYGYEIFASGIERRVAEPLEDGEFVVWGAPPDNLAVKAWDPVHRWLVDRSSSDVRVKHGRSHGFVDTPENRAKLDYSFQDYRTAVTEAFEVLSETHDGRIGDHEELPQLISEATDESLEVFIEAQGGYDLPDRVTPSVFPTPDGSVVYPTPTPVVHPTATPQPHWMVTRPTNLVATWDGEVVTLTWDAPDIDVEIVGYDISRGVGLRNGKPRANSFVWDTGSSETTFVDDGSVLPLYSGETHYYRVDALTVLGQGFSSEAAGVTVP